MSCTILTALASGLVGATVFELIKVWIVRKYFGPKIALAWNDDAGIVGPICQKGYKEYYARIVVTNEGRTATDHCSGYLVDVEMVNGDGTHERTDYNDYLPLHWAYLSPKQSCQGLNLHSKASRYLDLLHTNSNNDEFYPRIIPRSSRYIDLFRARGTYCFTIHVCGDGANRIELKLHLNWRGQWDELELSVCTCSMR